MQKLIEKIKNLLICLLRLIKRWIKMVCKTADSCEKQDEFKQPLSVFFVWHPADNKEIFPIVDYCTNALKRDPQKPFSRSMNLPVFHRTTSTTGIPTKIKFVSKKTIIFAFISEQLVGDDAWVDYIKELPKSDEIFLVPIALDDFAYKVSGDLSNINFIRTKDYDPEFKKELYFISIAHEIFRYSLNESFSAKKLGEETAIKIFLSHTKCGSSGSKIAQKLKDFIDNSPMGNFFDSTDIAPSYRFDNEIIGNIKKSTIIAIHSDPYSSRYWCQREILCAKENNRPIIAVDCLEEFEDRRFPFSSNIPSVHINFNGELKKNDLLRILCATMLETLRFFYSKLLLEERKQSGDIPKNAYITSRPPEASDINKILKKNEQSICCNIEEIFYPEPPLYNEEAFLFSNLGIKLGTLLTANNFSLKGKKIGISISDPTDNELTLIGQNKNHLQILSQDIARQLLIREAELFYGGDLREGGFTEFLFEEALILKDRLQKKDIHLTNYIAWPIHRDKDKKTISWKAKYRPVAKMIEVSPPDDVIDLIPDKNSFLYPNCTQNAYVWSRSLTEMRRTMIADCDVRICAGGKHSGYKGRMPGVLEEIYIAIELKKPLFLIGGFGGVASSVCKLINNKEVQEFTEEWQIINNSGYKDLLDFIKLREPSYYSDYKSIVELLKNCNLNNGLNKKENEKLFTTPFVDEAILLIIKGLKEIGGQNGQA